MDIQKGSRGEIVYAPEGFAVRWDPRGLEIDAIDYHTQTLRLDWKEILTLARIATGESQA